MSELTRFGLTHLQAKTYVVLLRLGTSRAGEIAREAKINRAEVYRLIKDLQKLGLVEVSLTRPVTFTPVAPDRAITALVARMKDHLTQLEATGNEVQMYLSSIERKKAEEEEEEEERVRLSPIVGIQRISDKAVGMASRAQKSLLLAASFEEFQRYVLIVEWPKLVKSLVRKRVQTKILLDIKEVDNTIQGLLKKVEPFKDLIEIRHVDNLATHIMIVDDEEMLLGVEVRPEPLDLWTNSPTCVNAIKTFFDQLWRGSIDLACRLRALRTGKPPEQTYLIKDSREVFQTIKGIVAQAKEEAVGISDSARLNALLEDYPVRELHARGIRLRIIAPIIEQNLSAVGELLKYSQIRHLASPLPRMIIIDGRHLFIFKKPAMVRYRLDDRHSYFEDTLYSNDSKFVASMKTMFEGIWHSSIDARSRIKELKVGKPVERMTILKDSDELNAWVNEKLRSMKYNGLVLTSKNGLVRTSFYPIEEVIKRGVKVRLLGPIDRDNVEAVKDLLARGCMVRHLYWPTFLHYLIVDDEEILMADFEEDLPLKGGLKVKTAIVSNQEDLVSTQSKLMEELWNSALDAQARISQLETERLGTIDKPTIEFLRPKP